MKKVVHTTLTMLALTVYATVFACGPAPKDASQPLARGRGDAARLSEAQLASLLRQAGFPEERVGTMVCIANKESQRYPEAWNENINGAGQVSSLDYGLFQINSFAWFKTCTGMDDWDGAKTILKDPNANTRCALRIFKSRGLNDWVGYRQNKAECDSYPAP